MTENDNSIIDIRRTVKESIEATDSTHRVDLVANVAMLTQTDAEVVADELARMQRNGEVYEVPSDANAGPEVRLP